MLYSVLGKEPMVRVTTTTGHFKAMAPQGVTQATSVCLLSTRGDMSTRFYPQLNMIIMTAP